MHFRNGSSDLISVADEIDEPGQLFARAMEWIETADEDTRSHLDRIIAEASVGDMSSVTKERLQALGSLAYVALEALEMLKRRSDFVRLN